MKRMKYVLFLLLIAVMFTACDREPFCVSFSDNSTLNTGRYIFTAKYTPDKLYKDKYVDLQFKSSKDSVTLCIGEELGNAKEVIISEKDEWYSLTTLLAISDGAENTEDFIKYDEIVNTTYIIESDNEFVLTVRAVVGDKQENGTQTGYILSNKIVCSEDFDLEIKANQTN